mmetsp:Transcript_29684/g.86497  ORF Transcript_29684/g.86497 Transcript_29684/m.86497 type:complete len:129 (-) Transcript_29684:206-592(-)
MPLFAPSHESCILQHPDRHLLVPLALRTASIFAECGRHAPRAYDMALALLACAASLLRHDEAAIRQAALLAMKEAISVLPFDQASEELFAFLKDLASTLGDTCHHDPDPDCRRHAQHLLSVTGMSLSM